MIEMKALWACAAVSAALWNCVQPVKLRLGIAFSVSSTSRMYFVILNAIAPRSGLV